jgi:hypothetical protein
MFDIKQGDSLILSLRVVPYRSKIGQCRTRCCGRTVIHVDVAVSIYSGAGGCYNCEIVTVVALHCKGVFAAGVNAYSLHLEE